MRTIQDMVQQEVLCCMSHIVSTVAGGYGQFETSDQRRNPQVRALSDLTEQAFELCSPIPDYEEAAIQAGWSVKDNAFVHADLWNNTAADEPNAWEALCQAESIEPYDCEVFEHWAITDWFAGKLEAAGEKVDKDFGNLCIWARTTTGQGIASDGVVERIYVQMMQLDTLSKQRQAFDPLTGKPAEQPK